MYLIHIFMVHVKFACCANILGVFTFPSYSHQILFQPIWRELSLRGHKVTVITPDPLNDPLLTNLTEISARNLYSLWKQTSIQELLSKDANIFINYHLVNVFAERIVETIFSSKYFQKLFFNGNKTFDLVLMESSSSVINVIGEKFQAPVVTICPLGGITIIYNIIGDPNHPVLYPDNFISSHGQQLTLWEKVISFLFTLWSLYYHHYVAIPRTQNMSKKFFGDGFSHVYELEKNITLTFVNAHPLIYPRRPNSPAMIEMHELHFKTSNPLPKDLQQILDESEEGVIYFSLGSNIKSAQLDENLKRIIIEALSELPYKVIWKYESNHLPNKPSNVITRKWLPQQDILAHKNIRAFITQGGLQSISESIFNAVPMIGLPFIGDQPMNLKKVVDLGVGIMLDPLSVTKEELIENIIEVSENKLYKRRVEEVHQRTYEKPMKSLEEAIWWCEYVIRHKGAKHLKSPNGNISWFDYLLLDVTIIIIVTVMVVTVIISGLCKLVKFKSCLILSRFN